MQHEAARSISKPPGRDTSLPQVTLTQFGRFPQQFTGTHLYSCVERGTVRVKHLAQEHKTMSSARARTQIARSWEKRTYHEATAPNQTCNTGRLFCSCKQYHASCTESCTKESLLVVLLQILDLPIIYKWK